MDSVQNPYWPVAGPSPSELAGRDKNPRTSACGDRSYSGRQRGKKVYFDVELTPGQGRVERKTAASIFAAQAHKFQLPAWHVFEYPRHERPLLLRARANIAQQNPHCLSPPIAKD
jgi:hypothetical protein